MVMEWAGGCAGVVAIFSRWYCYVWFVSGAGGECLYT